MKIDENTNAYIFLGSLQFGALLLRGGARARELLIRSSVRESCSFARLDTETGIMGLPVLVHARIKIQRREGEESRMNEDMTCTSREGSDQQGGRGRDWS